MLAYSAIIFHVKKWLVSSFLIFVFDLLDQHLAAHFQFMLGGAGF